MLTFALSVWLCLGFGMSDLALADQAIPVNPQEVYIPGGVNATAEAYVVISGEFPNTCFSWDHAEVENINPLFHEVRVYATLAGPPCAPVGVPYSREIQLGRLMSGEHTIRFMNNNGTYFQRSIRVD